MKAPLSWLSKYVDITLSPQELAHELTMAGIEVGSVNLIGEKWENDLLVGDVKEIVQHPNADRLKLATVGIGGQTNKTVVCGADNLEIGQKIAFANIGANLFDVKSGTHKELKPATIRGVVSEGMICSELELGIGLNHEGILVLPDDASVGSNLKNYLGDVILDIEVTPNRPDCLSMLGLAREISAITGAEIKEPELAYQQSDSKSKSRVAIQIHNTDLCKRYAATIIDGIKVTSSPKWLIEALLKAGHNSINNVVDITNFVMLEFGQPLHAFDLNTLTDSKINVREASGDERFYALNDEIATLNAPMLTISDSVEPVALAGIIGGKESAVSLQTTSILIESANFNPVNVRSTANMLGIATDASYIFERSPSIDLVPIALQRATKLILEVAGGTAMKGLIDIYPNKVSQKNIPLSNNKICKILGVELGKSEVLATLGVLGFDVKEQEIDGNQNTNNYELNIAVPYWRSDIAIPEDLVEEIARVIGYERIPPVMLTTPIPEFNPNLKPPKFELKELLASLGMMETISYPLSDLEALKLVEPALKEHSVVKTTNPMNSEMQYMRTSLVPSVLRTLSQNLKFLHGKPIRIFEMGRVYKYMRNVEKEVLPSEKEKIVGVLCGPRYYDSWLSGGENVDFYDAKGILELFFKRLAIDVNWGGSKNNVLRPQSSAGIYLDGIEVGMFGELKQEIADHFDIDTSVMLFEIDVNSVDNYLGVKTTDYYQINRFPSSERDISLVFDKSITSADVSSIISANKLVETVLPLDVYAGEGIPAEKRSITYRIIYRAVDKTLTADQVQRAQNSILKKLNEELGVASRF